MTVRPKILLDAVDFMALHLAALANDGVGSGAVGYNEHPKCAIGLASWLDEPVVGYEGSEGGGGDVLARRLVQAGFDWHTSDTAMLHVPRNEYGKIDFETFVDLLNIDIKESK